MERKDNRGRLGRSNRKALPTALHNADNGSVIAVTAVAVIDFVIAGVRLGVVLVVVVSFECGCCCCCCIQVLAVGITIRVVVSSFSWRCCRCRCARAAVVVVVDLATNAAAAAAAAVPSIPPSSNIVVATRTAIRTK